MNLITANNGGGGWRTEPVSNRRHLSVRRRSKPLVQPLTHPSCIRSRDPAEASAEADGEFPGNRTPRRPPLPFIALRVTAGRGGRNSKGFAAVPSHLPPSLSSVMSFQFQSRLCGGGGIRTRTPVQAFCFRDSRRYPDSFGLPHRANERFSLQKWSPIYGAKGWYRSSGLRVFNTALYQLSYLGNSELQIWIWIWMIGPCHQAGGRTRRGGQAAYKERLVEQQ
jgi:hypothetical protein